MKRVLIAVLALVFLQCVPEDGIDGLNGQDGIDGTNGTNGQDGNDGVSIGLESNALGNGCRELIFFKDSNNNGVKDSSESVVSSFEICDGTSPNIKLITEESESCANGGTVFIFFDDINDDGVIDSNESILGTETICNGLDGQNGTSVSLFIEEASLTDCPSGGLLITVFIDADGDGEYDEDTESIVTQTVACYPERATEIPTEGLIAYYPFSGNAQDGSNNDNDGTVVGATLTTDRHGDENSAFYFRGDCNDRIDANIDTSTISTNQSFTFSIWYYHVGNGCISPRLFEFWPGADGPSKFVAGGIIDSEQFIYFGTGANMGGNWNNIPQEWTHLVYTVDSNSFEVYQNGVLVDSGNTTMSNFSLAQDVAFGRMNHAAWDGINGKLDDIRLYNIKLSASQVEALFNE